MEGSDTRAIQHSSQGVLLESGAIAYDSAVETFFNVVDVLVAEDNETSGYGHWIDYNGMLLALAFVQDRTQTLLGSAVMVAPGIALAARHVVEEYKDELRNREVSLIGCGVSNSGLDLWSSWGVTIVEDTDLALISFDYASTISDGREFGLAGLTTRMPEVGEIVTVLGFRPSENNFSLSDQNSVSFSGRVLFGHGKVTQVFPNGRDKVMIPGPSFEIDCPSRGAMSGGPVFDKNGHVIGILTTSFSSVSDDGPSYGSLISRAFPATVSGGWRALSSMSAPTTLLRLSGDSCFIDRSDAVTVPVGEATSKNAVSCRQQS